MKVFLAKMLTMCYHLEYVHKNRINKHPLLQTKWISYD